MFEGLQILNNGVPELSATILSFVFFFGTFVSEDAICILAGSAAASGKISFTLAVVACFLGIFVSDIMLYAGGRIFGAGILSSRFLNRLVSTASVQKASDWLNRNSVEAIFVSRFISGLRLPTYLLAGALRTDFGKFALWFLIASAIWTPILVGSASFAQSYLFSKSILIGFFALVLSLRLAIKYSRWKNWRLLIGRIKRIWKWEFWPLTVFYAPVIVYVLLLAFKHRSLTAFTAANPALPAGGFKGESKNQIYCGLLNSEAGASHILPHALLRAESPVHERLLRAWSFLDHHGVDYPVVLKPDVGERGREVRIIKNASELEKEIILSKTDQIIQEFSPGSEVSVFYYRYPREERGHIFSITEKQFPTVTGDGHATLEKLILGDRRAVCLAKKYLEQNPDRLDHIPGFGETVHLVDIGTHSRGAIFLDGEKLRSERLEQKIDKICRGYDGFFFGRFDIRTSSFTDLMQGDNFKIIELNGVTSESTNIYDPRHSLLGAYRILFSQWRIAFEIGSENIKLGNKPSRLLDLVCLAFGRIRPSDSVDVCGRLDSMDRQTI